MSRKEKSYSAELKYQAVSDYLSGKGLLREICRKYKIRSTRQLRNWIKMYNGHKELKCYTGGSRMTKGRKTTYEERIAFVKECIKNGYNYTEISEKYKVGYQQIYTWVQKYKKDGEDALKDRRGRHKKDYKPQTEEERSRICCPQYAGTIPRFRLAAMDRKVFVHLRAVIVKDVLCSVQRCIFNAESAEVVDFWAFPVYSVT